MNRVLTGIVSSGKNDASKWLRLFNDAYSAKTGMRIFPGSLNLRLPHAFEWDEPAIQDAIIPFAMHEYGGERDILMLPCALTSLDGRAAYLWTTTTDARDREDRERIEIITNIGLRATFGLQDGDALTLTLSA